MNLTRHSYISAHDRLTNIKFIKRHCFLTGLIVLLLFFTFIREEIYYMNFNCVLLPKVLFVKGFVLSKPRRIALKYKKY